MSGGHNRFPLGLHGSAEFHLPQQPAPFNPQLYLTPYLDGLLGGIAGDAEVGSFTAAWRASPQSDLSDLTAAFPVLRKTLEAKLGKANLEELVALSQESDAELFWESALRLAHRLESQDRLEPSLSLLRTISSGVGSGYLDMRRAADRGAEVLLGHGEFGDRFEYMLRKVTHELSDPWAITAFGAGSLAFRAAKLGALSRIWASSAREYLPSRVAAEWIATGAGISVEAPVFVATSKLAHEFSGEHQDWRGTTLAKEIAGVGITLVGLRGTGALGEKAVQNLYFSKVAQRVAPQAATLGGILLAHRAEEHLQLRPATNGSTFLADGLTTFLQFAVGGRLADAALGAGFRTWQRQMDWRVASLSGRSGNWGAISPVLAPAGAGPSLWRGSPAPLELTQKPMMSENHGDGSGSHGSSGTGPRLHLVKGPETKGPKESQPPTPKFEDRPTPIVEPPAEGQQILDLSLLRMLRSRPMDEKFKNEVDAVILGSATETRRRTLDQEVIANLPVPRREELVRSLKNLPPDLVDVFGSAASDLPWQSMAQAFIEMKLIRTSPGEISESPSSGTSTRPWREAIADELRSDHRRLFDTQLPGAAGQLDLAMNRLSEATLSLLGHWTHSSGTRLLMGQRLGLPGIPAEPAILEAYQRWLSRSPESE